MNSASVAYRLNFSMRGQVMMPSDAVDAAPKNDAALIDDERSEGNAAFMTMIHEKATVSAMSRV